MPNASTKTPRGASESRSPEDNAGRAARAAGDSAQVATEAAGNIIERSLEVGRVVFRAWATGTEGTLQAMFDVQNAVVQAELSVLDAVADGYRAAGRQWADAALQVQQAVLDSVEAAVDTLEPRQGAGRAERSTR
jgi:hypothetical protein